jgi:AcrR family transcriptional regulator
MPGPETAPSSPTVKGRRTADSLVEAATVVLAREGIAGASVAAIADEAGVAKRLITYYFGTREGLLVQVVRRIGEQIVANVADAIAEPVSVDAAAAAGFDAMWAGLRAAPHLPEAYIALLAGARDGEARIALDDLRATFTALVREAVATQERAGRRLAGGEPEGLTVLILAIVRGLVLEWVEAGDTPALDAGVAEARRLVAGAFTPAG